VIGNRSGASRGNVHCLGHMIDARQRGVFSDRGYNTRGVAVVVIPPLVRAVDSEALILADVPSTPLTVLVGEKGAPGL
jgi:hypothetical protein